MNDQEFAAFYDMIKAELSKNIIPLFDMTDTNTACFVNQTLTDTSNVVTNQFAEISRNSLVKSNYSK